MTHRHGMFCSVFGCSGDNGTEHWTVPNPTQHWTYEPAPRGCVCPAGAEKSCKGDHCPRQPAKPEGMTS
jgi:hypothetical protein